MKSAAKYLVAMMPVLCLVAEPVVASCGDRPGTPDLVKAEATSAREITFTWRNTTGKQSSTTQAHQMWFDISVRDGAGNMVEKDRGGSGPYNVVYHGESSTSFRDLAPGTTLCIRTSRTNWSRHAGLCSRNLLGPGMRHDTNARN